ncbi:hypothetical protein B0H14DRAFT_2808229, partial [Mycena olivaceomarginata]
NLECFTAYLFLSSTTPLSAIPWNLNSRLELWWLCMRTPTWTNAHFYKRLLGRFVASHPLPLGATFNCGESNHHERETITKAKSAAPIFIRFECNRNVGND